MVYCGQTHCHLFPRRRKVHGKARYLIQGIYFILVFFESNKARISDSLSSDDIYKGPYKLRRVRTFSGALRHCIWLMVTCNCEAFPHNCLRDCWMWVLSCGCHTGCWTEVSYLWFSFCYLVWIAHIWSCFWVGTDTSYTRSLLLIYHPFCYRIERHVHTKITLRTTRNTTLKN